MLRQGIAVGHAGHVVGHRPRPAAPAVALLALVNADQCVMCTLQDANFLGYDCILVSDCTATTSPDYCWQATLYNVKQCFGFVTESRALLDALGAL